MTGTLLDFSRHGEIAMHASIVAAIESAAKPLGITPLIAGAFARDLHLHFALGIENQRVTEDIDIALTVPDWATFAALRQRLIASGMFREYPGVAHRLRHQNGLPVDLVPFGSVETRERTIHWPPAGDEVMNVFGFREALATAHDVLLPGGVLTKAVSLPALALLKIVCWQDRHYTSPRKDAQDLLLILRNYLRAGNEDRLWKEFAEWTQEDSFEYEFASARMLGHDMRTLLDSSGIERVGNVISEQADLDAPGLLPSEMVPNEPNRARALLNEVLIGLTQNWRR